MQVYRRGSVSETPRSCERPLHVKRLCGWKSVELVFEELERRALARRTAGASIRRVKTKMSSASSRDGSRPAISVTNAFGTAWRMGSGLGTIAASATAGCSMRTLSSSNGLIR
jgi:hypothetical protein